MSDYRIAGNYFSVTPQFSSNQNADRAQSLDTALDRIRTTAAYSSCKNSDSASKIKELLEKQNHIKVVTWGGGGYGNQKSTITGMRRLMELGFRGKFVLDTNAQDKEKLDFLLDNQNLPIDENPPAFSIKLGFCFGGSPSRLPAAHQVESFFILQPTDWCSDIDSVSTISVGSEHKMSKLLASGILETEISTPSPLPSDANHVLLFKQNNDANLIAVYGLHSWPLTELGKAGYTATRKGLTGQQELNLIIRSLLQRNDQIKPTVVCLLGSAAQYFSDHEATSQKLKALGKTSELLSSKVESSDVFLVKLPTLKADEFDNFIGNADLLISEGANTLSTAKSRKIPFLAGGRDILNHNVEKNSMFSNPLYSRAQEALTMAYPENIFFAGPNGREGQKLRMELKQSVAPLTSERRTAHLTNFIDECLSGKFSSFYEKVTSDFRSRPDKVFASLETLFLNDGERR